MDTLAVVYVLSIISIATFTYITDGNREKWSAVKAHSESAGRSTMLISLSLIAIVVYSWRYYAEHETVSLIIAGVVSLIAFYVAMRIADA